MRCWINHPVLITRHLHSLLAEGRFAHRLVGKWEQMFGHGSAVPHRMIPLTSGGVSVAFCSVLSTPGCIRRDMKPRDCRQVLLPALASSSGSHRAYLLQHCSGPFITFHLLMLGLFNFRPLFIASRTTVRPDEQPVHDPALPYRASTTLR